MKTLIFKGAEHLIHHLVKKTKKWAKARNVKVSEKKGQVAFVGDEKLIAVFKHQNEVWCGVHKIECTYLEDKPDGNAKKSSE